MELVNNIDLDRLGVQPGDRVLDLGCARGEHTIQLAKRCLKAVGADTDAALLEILRREAAAQGVECETLLIDVQEGLPYQAFDAVVCTEVLEHVPNYRQAMAEIAKALKPGACACIAVPTAVTEIVFHRLHPQYVNDSTHVNVFTKSLLTGELERAGLRVLHTEGRNFEWTIFWLLHGAARSRFDHTGSPIEHESISRFYWRLRRVLRLLKIERALIAVGNRVLPKSLYVYVTPA